MPRGALYDLLSSDEFECLVAEVCQLTLGVGTITFTDGPDGGRDARFHGTAKTFPSETDPLTGKFIIQAKHVRSRDASCSDTSFQRILEDEYQKVEALAQNNEVDHYVLFTNRRLTAGADQKFWQKFTAIPGVKSAYLIARETLDLYLDSNPQVKDKYHINPIARPFKIEFDTFAYVIDTFHENIGSMAAAVTSADQFSWTYIDEKNKINNLTEKYFKNIKETSLPHFSDIESFLQDPRNEKQLGEYLNVAYEIKAKYAVKKESFASFDEVIAYVYDYAVENFPELKANRRHLLVFLHFMYCNCDIGEHATST